VNRTPAGVLQADTIALLTPEEWAGVAATRKAAKNWSRRG